jgi:hypothetical protein
MNEVAVIGDIPPDMEYACGLRSVYMVANELFLWHNFDILLSAHLHFPGVDHNIFPEPRSGDICFHKRMLLAGLRFALQPIAPGAAVLSPAIPVPSNA